MPTSENNLTKIYENRFPKEDLKKKEALWKILIDHFFQRYVPVDSVVMDIGAGFCEFINNIQCKEKIAVDLNPSVYQYANSNVKIVFEDSTNLVSIEDNQVDVVFASNFFEHLPNKDAFLQTLKEIHRVLRPKGRLLILQPNIAFLNGAYWDFIDHHIPLTHKSLVEALSISGFETKEMKARFLPYTTRSNFPLSPLLIRLYLMLPPAHLFLGKQAWVFGEKI